MGIIDSAYRDSQYQLGNLWEFEILPKGAVQNWGLTSRVKTSSLPFNKLEVETRNSGEKVYTGFTPVTDFSITLYETTSFECYNYFKKWLDTIFDADEGAFISYPYTIKGSVEDPIHRQGRLSFESFNETNLEKNILFIYENIKILGIESIDTSYDNVEPLEITINMTADRVYQEKNSGFNL